MIGSRYQGFLYRALNPRYAREPLSGRGAATYGGRFNRKGREALYLSLAPETAIREASQVGTLQPTMLVAYRADLEQLFDTRESTAMIGYDMAGEMLADQTWRERMAPGHPVPTQEFAEQLIADGYVGMLVRSFARGSTPDDSNLVVWRWNTGEAQNLLVVDDEKRLRQD